MAVSRPTEELVLERLRPLGEIEIRRMFGGLGVYLEGVFFALVPPGSDRLHFRVNDANRPDYEARGMEPFRPKRGRPLTMPYYEVPADVLEDGELLADWAAKAHAAARDVRRGPRRRGRPR